MTCVRYRSSMHGALPALSSPTASSRFWKNTSQKKSEISRILALRSRIWTIRMDAVEFLLSSELRYVVYLFATETEGANRDKVALEFGRNGIKTLDELLAKQALRLNTDGTFQGTLSVVANAPDTFVKRMAHLHVDMIDLADAGSLMRCFHREVK